MLVVEDTPRIWCKDSNDPIPRYLRICLWLDDELKLKLKITVYSENLRKPHETTIEITKQKLEKYFA